MNKVYLLVEENYQDTWNGDTYTEKRVVSAYASQEEAEAALKRCKPISVSGWWNAFPTCYSVEEVEFGKEIPKPEITVEDLNEVGYNISLADYPSHLITRELCLAAVKKPTMKKWDKPDEQLGYVPLEICDAEICIAAVKRYMTESAVMTDDDMDDDMDDDNDIKEDVIEEDVKDVKYSEKELIDSDIWDYVPKHLRSAVLSALTEHYYVVKNIPLCCDGELDCIEYPVLCGTKSEAEEFVLEHPWFFTDYDEENKCFLRGCYYIIDDVGYAERMESCRWREWEFEKDFLDKENPTLVDEIPLSEQTFEKCLPIVKESIFEIVNAPVEIQEKLMDELFATSDFRSVILKDNTYKRLCLFSEAFCLKLIINGFSLEEIPVEARTRTVCTISVIADSANKAYVPDALLEERICVI